jgi:hypothetical protein
MPRCNRAEVGRSGPRSTSRSRGPTRRTVSVTREAQSRRQEHDDLVHNGTMTAPTRPPRPPHPTTRPQVDGSHGRELVIGSLIALVIGVLLLTGPPWWFGLVGLKSSTHSTTSSTSPSLTSRPSQASQPSNPPASPIVGFSGGCAAYQVFAQNRWAPVGTAIREAPNVLSTQIGSFPGNMSISVNGWLHGRVAYPTNVAPYNSDIWFHLADGAGWVSYGGVRAYPIALDPTGTADGGPPAATPAQCYGAVQ